MSRRSTHQQRSWVNQCRFRSHSHQLVSHALLTRKVNSPLLGLQGETLCRLHCQHLAHAALKKSPVLPLVRCGINFMFGVIVGYRANLCNAPKPLATNRLWSQLIRPCLVVVSEMCVVVLLFHQKSVSKLSSTAFAIRDGHISL